MWMFDRISFCDDELATQSCDKTFCGRHNAFCARLVVEHTFHASSTTFRYTHAPTSTTILSLTCLPCGTRQNTLTVVLRDVLMGLVPLYNISQAKQPIFTLFAYRTRTLFRLCSSQLAIVTFKWCFYGSTIFGKHYSRPCLESLAYNHPVFSAHI